MTARGNHGVGLADDVLPQGDGGAGNDAAVGHGVAVADGHALVVGIMGGQQLLGGEDVEEVDVQRYVLHVAGYGVQLAEQAQGIAVVAVG